MKKIWTLLVSLIVLSSCNDGNLIEDTFNFSNATVQKCTSSNILYKINDKEALILNTPDTSFQNKEQTQNIPINGTTSIEYRKFSTNTNTNEICATPSIPVIETWNVVGGTLEIVSTKIMNATNTSVAAYNHKITFRNVTFITPNKQVVYDSYEFGSYRTDIIDLAFNYTTASMQNCSGNNLIFKYNGSNALLFDVRSTLFNNTVGTKTQVIDTNNKVIYRVYNGSLNSNFFCSAITPSTPSLTEEWIAQDGVTVTSGEIRVVTVRSGSQYKHTIKLYNTTFKKGILEYNPAPNAEYVFGDYFTN